MADKEEVKLVVKETTEVKPEVKEEVKEVPAETVEPKEDNLKDKLIPKQRLDEEIAARKQSEERAQLLETQMAIMQSQIASQSSIKETEETNKVMIDDLMTEMGWEEDRAKKFIQRQRDIVKSEMAIPMKDLYSRTSATMSRTVLNDVLEDMPRAKKYRADIEKKLNLLRDPTMKTDASVVKDVVRLILGEKLEEIEKEAELRGSTSAETQKKIVNGIGVEPVSSSGTKTLKPLSDTEKKIAANMGLTEKQYQEGKEKVRK